MVRTVPLRSARPLLHHRRHRCGLGVARLEDRTLLSGPSGDVLNVVLAVADLTGNGTKDIIYASQNLDNVVVDYGEGQRIPVGASSGLLAPGAVAVADLNDNGIPDLIVANSGGNNVLVYPGQGNGQFGPALNGGQGFFTGTDPVGVTVANLNGRLDLVIADRGSNDVTILLNQPTADGGFTFVQGQRLNLETATQQGIGPVATAIVPSPSGGPSSLAVSLSGSNQVWVIPGVGGGFFNDQNPTIFSVGNQPGPLFVGNFDGKPDLVTVNAGSNDLTLISDFMSADHVTSTISSGGTEPDAAFSFSLGSGFDNLVVGNGGDGVLALFEGSEQGLTLTSSETNPDLPSPTALAYSALTGGQIQFYAATAGREVATLVDLSLGGETQPPPSTNNLVFFGNFGGGPGQLTVNSGSNDLTLITDFMGSSPTTRTFGSGGVDPVWAVMFHSDNGFDNLIVANKGDGHVALLEGSAEGLILDPDNIREVPSPTALKLSSFTGGLVEVYATTEGNDTAPTLLTFRLGGETGGISTVPGLQPLRDAALPLIASLLTLTIETSTVEFDLSATNGEAAAAVSFLPVSTVTMGQSLPEHASTGESENGDEEEPNEPQEPDLPVTQESSSWQPFFMGLDEALDQFCRDHLDQFMSRDEPAPDKAQPPHALSKPLNLWQRDQASPEARGTIGTDSNHLPEANQGQIIDEAIRSLWADESRPVRTSLTPTSVPLTSDGTTPAETAPADATLLSTEPVQRQDGPLLSSYERGFEALTEFAVSLLLAAFVARRIDPPGTRHCTPTNPFSSLRLLRRPLFRFR